MATQIAVQLTCGLFSGIYSHVDPMHIGEAGRMMRIAQKYGEMLQTKESNITGSTLERLTTGYPSHEFVIDRSESEKLFRRVRQPSKAEEELATALRENALFPSRQQLVAYLSAEHSTSANAEAEPAAEDKPEAETVTRSARQRLRP